MERCELWVADWAGQRLTLPGMAQAYAVRKSFEPVGPETPPKDDQWHYYATSAPFRLLRPKQAALTIRNHWAIENKLHWRKDVTLGEDAHLLRKGNAPVVMSALRSLALGLIDLIDIPGLPAQTTPQKIAYLGGHPERVLAALGGKGII